MTLSDMAPGGIVTARQGGSDGTLTGTPPRQGRGAT
jgi:hypothetical protein